MSARTNTVEELLKELRNERYGLLPVWIRPPKNGPEHYSGLGRSKLYELNAQGKIKSRSIREPGQVKGTRLFHLQSIFDFIENCEGKEVSSDEVST